MTWMLTFVAMVAAYLFGFLHLMFTISKSYPLTWAAFRLERSVKMLQSETPVPAEQQDEE